MHKAEYGEHVVYHRLESADKDGKYPVSSFPALIIGHDPGGDDIAHVAFLNPEKKHLIGSADWRDAFDGAHSVPLGQGPGRDWYELLPKPASTDTKKLQDFLLKNFKKETGNETPVDCAIRLLSKNK